MSAAKDNGKDASLTLNLKADSGYRSTETARISAEQWARILTIVNEVILVPPPAA